MNTPPKKPKPQRRPRPQAMLEARFDDRMRFIYRSTRTFEAGDYAEADNIATHLRVLLHKPKCGEALLRTLHGALDTLKLYDTSIPGGIVVKPQMIINGMVGLRMAPGITDYSPGFYRPDLGRTFATPIDPKTRMVPFKDWWAATVFSIEHTGTEYSREDIVLNVADQDGAHVDAGIDETWAQLVMDRPAQFPNMPTWVEGALVAQIGYELTQSLLVRPDLAGKAGEAAAHWYRWALADSKDPK